ncbi:hypothetical protein [Desulfosporosinus sp. BG]|uniref:lysine 5,6-aminomutase reactivase subunit KamB n=1 Tax=Desulfosporosinus sp. BG TaxID=1633135 RepID=UPI00083AF8B3|nr:hypothetical protein [Desulfosporosinus sp. BG]ODA39679.1 hypothetical protein DSBG_3536 [Desulfosporosinus sp. BG]
MSHRQLILGVSGTAKNTGKTTTTISLLNYFTLQRIKLGLTSIGYDGESVDNVTGLPKPRLFVPRGVLVVTAARCLEVSSAKLSVIETLPIPTPLGKLVCAKVEREGLVVTAGPNQTRHLRTVREWLYRHGAELIIVDGALNRMAPMVETDGLILATGASYKPDSQQVAFDAQYLAEACNCLPVPQDLVREGLLNVGTTVVWGKNHKILAATTQSLLEPGELEPLERVAQQAVGLYCPGLITPSCLRRLMEIPFAPAMLWVMQDPTKILIANEPSLIHGFLLKIREAGSSVVYRKPLPLLAITVNPFYPQYRYETDNYEPAYVERSELKELVAKAAKIPVFDVVQDDCLGLASVILACGCLK